MTGGSSDYYDLPYNSESLQDVIEGKDMGYSRGNIFKAVYRWGCKGGDSDLEYDLRKIRWFVERELTRVQSRPMTSDEMVAYVRKKRASEKDSPRNKPSNMSEMP